MSVSLFVRSYENDFNWLRFSIASMKKYLIGVDQKVLVVPWKTKVPTEIESFFDTVVESFMYEAYDGYVAQQFDKLDAYKYVNSDHILYSDSDCIYTDVFNVSTMFSPLPVLGMTPYRQLEGSDGHNWKAITENLLSFKVSHEFMRSFPIIHKTDLVAAFSNAYPEIYKKVTGRNISEFNLLGAYAFEYEYPYHFTEDVPRYPCKQYWSWSGLTSEEQQEIQGYLE